MSRLPEGWRIINLEDIVIKMQSGGTPKSTNEDYYKGNIPFVKIDDITSCNKYLTSTKNSISEEALNSSSTWLVPENSILYSMYASIGFLAINKVPVATNQAIMNLIPDSSKITLEYLYQYLLDLKDKIDKFVDQTTQKNLNAQKVKKFKIPLPPLKEQKKIAEILSTVDEKIAFVDKSIEETQTLKKGLMQKLLTEGIAHTEFKESELGRIPVEWEVVKLGDLTSLTAGGTPSTKIKSYWTPKEIPWLSSGEVNKKIVFSTDNMISKEGLNNSAAKLVPKYSVLIGLAGQGKTRGTVAITEIDLTTNQSVASILPNDSIDMYFIYHNLDSRYEEIRSMSTGVGGRGGLNLSILKSINIALPPLEEQKEIATILNTADRKLETLREKKKSYEELKKGLMQKLLTGEIRV